MTTSKSSQRYKESLMLFFLLMTITFANANAQTGNRQKLPPAREIPGITVKDLNPSACVDCHINRKDANEDRRISTLMAKWAQKVEGKLLLDAKAASGDPSKIKGKHPMASSSLKNIPKACLGCHKQGSKIAPSFAQLMHLIHLGSGDENDFMTRFQGECTHCHKLDQKTGLWMIPSAAEH